MKISWVDFAPTNDSVIDDTPLNNERQTFVQIMLPALGLFFFIGNWVWPLFRRWYSI